MADTIYDIPDMTFKQAANALGVARSTLYRLINSGVLQGHKCGVQWRFYRSDVRRCVRQVTNPHIRT